MSVEKKKILWTVDPFAKNKELQRSAAWAIKNLTQGSSSIIEPIYFFSAYITTDEPLEIPRDLIRGIQASGQKQLDEILSRIKLDGIRPLHVISQPYLSIREGVDLISRIAKRWKADLIITSTHARKGIKRWVLGSFAETLLLHSDVPIFFVNPHWNRSSKFRHILFPTDFSQESKEAFHQVIKFTKSLGSDFTLFHTLAYIWPPTMVLSIGPAPLYTDAFGQELEARRRDASQWAEEAKKEGIQITTYVDHKLRDSITASILKVAKKRGGLIAMASRSGPAKTTLLGSTTRKIVRESPYPVWVLHPKLRAQEQSDKVRPIRSAPMEPLFSVTEEDITKDLEHIPGIKKRA
jgi:nucleotide-binding universal stress UspA family protein